MRIDNEKKIVLRINRDASISLNNQIILADSSSNDISVRLPNLLSQLNQLTSQGYFFEVKKISSSNSVFIIPPSGQLIDNQALITLSNLNEGVYLKFDGNNYQIVSSIIYGSSGSSSYITSVSDTSTVNLSVVGSNLRADFTSMNISQFTNDSGYLTASGLSGYVPTSRTISINGTSYDLSSNRSWSVGTITSIALSGGTGISISGSPITTSGTIIVTNTAPDQTVTLNNGTGISITGTYPTFTITNSSPSSGGTVTSIALSGGTTGLSFSNSPITSSGTMTLSGTLAIANGGTGANNLDEFTRVWYKDTTAHSITGVSVETGITYFALPLNMTNVTLRITLWFRVSTYVSGSIPFRFRLGTNTGTPTAGTQIALSPNVGSASGGAMKRTFICKPNSIQGWGFNSGLTTDESATIAYSTASPSWASQQYLFITCNPINSGNVVEVTSILVEIIGS